MDKYEIKTCFCGRCPEVLNPKVKNLKEGVWIRRAHSSVNHLPVRLHIIHRYLKYLLYLSSLLAIFETNDDLFCRWKYLASKIMFLRCSLWTWTITQYPAKCSGSLAKSSSNGENCWHVCFNQIVWMLELFAALTAHWFWPFTLKTSSMGEDKVNKWEFCKLKITTIVVFIIMIQRIFPR